MPQYCVLNLVPQGGATLLIFLHKNWMLSCAEVGHLAQILGLELQALCISGHLGYKQ